MMAEFIGDTPDGRILGSITYLGIIFCKIYGKIKTIKRYRQCKIVRYYRKEH